ncbi:Type I phosphodiesterase / nucleotide pyrophosphatase [Agromyces sp. CF514]|uniref:alkaline phosphatase family protein n=1 Tax=Agromyces sp. CF514 TaxID=1881031 RepID=UPI0008E31CB1|nr:alkaline phosphatase family protein [Agromyces sp. CF514]SFR90302.1 Type I phosphodiesterase / nucleotide pyrophosphatase [Agromyces sp. CF514]
MPSPNRALRAVSTSFLAAALVATPLCAQAAQAAPAAMPAPAAAPDTGRSAKTLVVGIDGASFDFLEAAEMPNLDGLRAGGLTSASNLYAQPMAGTVSGAGWSTIATGVWPDKHNVVDNSFSNPKYGEYPDYLSRIEAATPQRDTLVVGTWTPIPQMVFGSKVDTRIAGGSDVGTTAKAVEALSAGDPDDVFVHLDDVDGAGHSVGTNGAAYAAALKKVDGQLGQILAAVESRPTRSTEDWTIIVTADHGHTPTGGHGGSTPAERKTFVVATGPGIAAGSVRNDVKIVDIAPTVLAADGIAADPAWKLDGTAIGDLKADDFDALRPVLQGKVDETRPANGVLGWTHTTPEGWSIDNSRMPAGGVAEWAGWSFATDDFWTNVELGQRRETSVRSRDVFAVADSDEWDDKSHAAGQFDSTLVSPAYPLTGAATATLAYATNYFIDGPQSAEVLVSYDGGAPQSLKAYAANTNANERLAFDVPAGARTAQFRFHYTGTNSAFWTVDRVALEQDAAPELPDTTKPVATLAAPTAAGPFRALDVQVDATDDRGLKRIVANVYRDGTLVKSTQSAMNGATAGTHRATVSLPDGAYTVKFNAEDLAGNIARTGTFAFTIDATAPTATVKTGAGETIGADGVYDRVSFKLYDAGKIDKVVLNGVVKDLTNNAWSDLNGVKPGVLGAVRGANTLVVHDVAGNTSTVAFTLN